MLKSWAVPKGPSIDPDDKRLAVRTEDHPLDYGTFEGVIPKGEYGGGTVMLWDRGRWVPEPGKDPSKTIEEGHLHFELEGERMKGEWVMFRLKGRPGEKGENLDAQEGRRRVHRAGRGAGRAGRDQRYDRAGAWPRSRLAPTFGIRTRARRAGGRSARRVSRRRNSRSRSLPRWSMRCRPEATGSMSINMTATGCCSRPAAGRRPRGPATGNDWTDKFRGIVKAAADIAGGMPDRWRGGRAGQGRQARFRAAAGDVEGRRRRVGLLRLRPAGR